MASLMAAGTYESDQSKQTPNHIRLDTFKTTAGTLTRLSGNAEDPTESTMSKAQVSLMNLYFPAFESTEVCNYHANTACILGLIIINFKLPARYGRGRKLSAHHFQRVVLL